MKDPYTKQPAGAALIGRAPYAARRSRPVTSGSLAAGQKALLAALFAMAVAGLLSANPLVSILCVLAFGWLWFGALRSPFKTVMAAYLTFQWLQVTTAVWLANAFGADLALPQAVSLGPSGAVLEIRETSRDAVLFGLGAISLISLGFRLVGGISRPIDRLDLPYRPSALLGGYAALLVVHLFAGPFVGGGLAQPIIVLGQLRFLFAALLLYVWILNRSGGGFIAAVVLVELVVGFSGFFSGFKEIFFVLAIALLTLAPIKWRRVAPLIAASVAVTLLLGGLWTAVKGDYRAALNEGKRSQQVTLSVSERWETLQSLAGGTTSDDLSSSFSTLAIRISYTEYLSIAMKRIPEVQPHSGGEVWGAAVQNALVPRILFPDKPALVSDSELTMRYTGLVLASGQQGTSISMGYAADSYIDFGLLPAGLIFLLMGLFYGAVSAFVASRFGSGELFAAVGAIIVLLSPVAHFETSIVKLFAGFLWTTIVVSAFAAIVWPLVRPQMVTRGGVKLSRKPRFAAGGDGGY